MDPTGSANNTEPSCASFKCRRCWMSGILDAQLAKQIPATKKKVLTAIRAVLGNTIEPANM